MYPYKCSCRGGTEQNIYNSFWNMAGFRGLCGQFPSWINITCLEGVACISRPSTPHILIAAHAFCPSSPCFSFAKATVSTLVKGPTDRQDEEHSSHPLLSLHSIPIVDWCTLIQNSPPLDSAPPSLLPVMWRSEFNVGNMSSSVYLTLLVLALAMS